MSVAWRVGSDGTGLPHGKRKWKGSGLPNWSVNQDKCAVMTGAEIVVDRDHAAGAGGGRRSPDPQRPAEEVHLRPSQRQRLTKADAAKQQKRNQGG
jgi:hypothetical protein